MLSWNCAQPQPHRREVPRRELLQRVSQQQRGKLQCLHQRRGTYVTCVTWIAVVHYDGVHYFFSEVDIFRIFLQRKFCWILHRQYHILVVEEKIYSSVSNFVSLYTFFFFCSSVSSMYTLFCASFHIHLFIKSYHPIIYASTAVQDTNYYFDVNAGHLPGALDIFSRFFVDPLFTESATGRELNAIDNENSKNLMSDPWRLIQVCGWERARESGRWGLGRGTYRGYSTVKNTRPSYRYESWLSNCTRKRKYVCALCNFQYCRLDDLVTDREPSYVRGRGYVSRFV